MKFTDSQLDAIAHGDGHLQLIACAGSGKTEVVARRVVELLRPRDGASALEPRNVVAFTFTDKAAAELKDRIVRRVHEQLGSVAGMAEMYVGTIHGFCKTLLNEEVPTFLKFDVLNPVQHALFVDRYSQLSGLGTSRDLKGAPLVRYKDTGRYIHALDILRQAEVREDQLAGNTVAQGLVLYRKLLDDRRYLDFTAIMEHALRVLRENVDVRKRLAERVRHVIVDEYQDVNPLQEKVVGALADLGAWLCVVGDDDQTIFQWNGADVRNILSFATRYPNVRTIRLQENFRSSRAIVEVARDFIAQNTNRLAKEMKPTDAQPSAAGEVLALGLKDPDEEASFIARTIRTLHGTAFTEGTTTRGLAWSDFAVLIRSGLRKNAAPIVRALTEAKIPFVIEGMNNLFETREANAARALFYFLGDFQNIDENALRVAWTNAALGLAQADLDRGIALAVARRGKLTDVGEDRWSTYNLQRVFLDFIEALALREERVPEGRGEVVFYNLGQFSQLISDFETIHFHSKPKEKYEAFARFLFYSVDEQYAEGIQKNVYASPDAVRILTVHKAKGLQWPVVFVPGVLRNRFPMPNVGGATAWHLLPPDAIVDADRFKGGTEDERRLFYVAMTRAQRYLFVTWAPVPQNQRSQKPSEFVEWLHGSKWVVRFDRGLPDRPRAAPTPRDGVSNVTLSFSELKYFFECPYQFKLRVLYGFNAPIAEALGYGRSLHNALADVHKRALEGRSTHVTEVPELLDVHLHLPYAYPAMKDTLRESGARVLHEYLTKNRALLDTIEFAEKTIEVSLGGGVTVAGRIDLVYRRDTQETSIVDLKSSARAQADDVTETQLHIYALGYEELTLRSADYVEIWELEEQRKKPRAVDRQFMDDVREKVRGAADGLRRNHLPVAPGWQRCKACDYCSMCSAGTAATDTSQSSVGS